MLRFKFRLKFRLCDMFVTRCVDDEQGFWGAVAIYDLVPTYASSTSNSDSE